MSVAAAPAAKRTATDKSKSVSPVAKKRRRLSRTKKPVTAPQPKPPATAPTPEYVIPNLQTVIAKHDVIRGIHPACAALPLIDGQCFDSLCREIAKSGLLDPIRLDEAGRIVDGRCRLLACYAVGVEPRFVTSTDDPWAIAMSNVARRFLSVGQRAVVATRIADGEKADAERRKKAGLLKGKTPSASQANGAKGKATAIAAKQLGISADSVEKAAKLPPDLSEKVMKKELSLHAASKEADVRAGKTKPAKPKTSKSSGKPRAESKTSADEEFPMLFHSTLVWVMGHRDSKHQAVFVRPAVDKLTKEYSIQITNSTEVHRMEDWFAVQEKAKELLRNITAVEVSQLAKRAAKRKKKAESAA